MLFEIDNIQQQVLDFMKKAGYHFYDNYANDMYFTKDTNKLLGVVVEYNDKAGDLQMRTYFFCTDIIYLANGYQAEKYMVRDDEDNWEIPAKTLKINLKDDLKAVENYEANEFPDEFIEKLIANNKDNLDSWFDVCSFDKVAEIAAQSSKMDAYVDWLIKYNMIDQLPTDLKDLFVF